jgi:hypothetical protein
VTPLLLVGLGLVVLGVGVAVLLSFGSRYRIGRLLASAPAVTVGEAVRIATASERRYVRITGRIDSDRDFEDADHRPLVLRRTWIQSRVRSRVRSIPGRWRTVESGLEVVPFELNEGLDTIAIDTAALRDGLIVIPRQSVGVAGDLGERAPAGVDPTTPTRVSIEQVSSVEHAIAIGSPVVGASGQPQLTAGLGRPLILTTLEIPEAMRILTGGAVIRSRVAAACLAAGSVAVALGAAWWAIRAVVDPAAALAASPVPSILPGADTRSSGQGPGLVGDPALALLGVAGIAIVVVLATMAYVRLTATQHEG